MLRRQDRHCFQAFRYFKGEAERVYHFIELLSGKNTMVSMWYRTQDSKIQDKGHAVSQRCTVRIFGGCTAPRLFRHALPLSRLPRVAARQKRWWRERGIIGLLPCNSHLWLSVVQDSLCARHGHVYDGFESFCMNLMWSASPLRNIRYNSGVRVSQINSIPNLLNKTKTGKCPWYDFDRSLCAEKFFQLSLVTNKTPTIRPAAILTYVIQH